MDRSRGFRRNMAGDAAGEGELPEKLLHAFLVTGNVRVELAVAAFEIGVGDQRGAAMPGTCEVDHVEIVLLDRPVHVHVNEVEPRRRSPMAEKSRLDMIYRERNLKKRVVVEIDLAHGKIIRGAPVGIHLVDFFLRQSVLHAGSCSRFGYILF